MKILSFFKKCNKLLKFSILKEHEFISHSLCRSMSSVSLGTTLLGPLLRASWAVTTVWLRSHWRLRDFFQALMDAGRIQLLVVVRLMSSAPRGHSSPLTVHNIDVCFFFQTSRTRKLFILNSTLVILSSSFWDIYSEICNLSIFVRIF